MASVGLAVLLVGGLIVLTGRFEAGAIGATLGGPIMAWLIVGFWARASSHRWPWWRYGLSVVLVWFGLRLLSLIGTHSQTGSGS
jgi:hypothetical protein